MRVGDYEEGARVLDVPGLEKYPPAQQLVITAMTLPFSRISREARQEQAHAMYEKAVRLEESVGVRTATTAYLLGTALVHQEQYGRAIEVLRDGVELCPISFGLRTNASRAAWRVELLAEARAHAEAAIELRPQDVKPFDTLVRILLTEREFDAALAVTERAPFADRASGRQKRLVLEAQTETERALHQWMSGDHESARASAATAVERFDRARAERELEVTSEETICRALDEGEPRRAFLGVADLLAADPLRWRRLQIVLEWMPKDLDPDESAALKRYVHALRDLLANQEELTQRELAD
jgi:tetratricopeptide (TPR) repeat protein